MKTIYMAHDGEMFYTEKDCLAYEENKREPKIQYSQFWDEDGKPLSIEEFLSEPGLCDYIWAYDVSEATAIEQVCREEMTITPWTFMDKTLPGRYYYDHEDNKWHSFDIEWREMMDRYNIFEGI